MTAGAPFWEEPGGTRTIRIVRAPPPAVVALLSATVWGSRSLRYRILDVAEKLARFRDPYYLLLENAGRLEAVLVLDRCEKRLLGRAADGFHVAMVATEPDLRHAGLASLLIAQTRRFFDGEVRPPGFGFGYIEETTVYSLRLSEKVGPSIEAAIPLVGFSRLFPRDDSRVGTLAEGEAPELLDRLEALYADHELADFDAALRPADYLVLRENGRILAGAQVETLRWSVVSMPGLAGWLVLSVLPRVPVLNRIVTPDDLRFLRFGAILAEPGREAALAALMEAALARRRVPIGLIMMDARSPVLSRIRTHGRFGLLAKALAGDAKLHMDTVGLDDADAARLAARPLLVSPADVF